MKALVVLLVAHAIIPCRAEAVIYNYQRTDADAVSYGVSLIDRGLAATEVFHSVGSFTNIQGSAVLLTDGTPAGTLNIAPVPAANGTKIEMGGYGFYGASFEPALHQYDGQPRGGVGFRSTDPLPPGFSEDYYVTSTFNGGPNATDPLNVSGAPGDSGGYVGDLSGNLIGIIVAADLSGGQVLEEARTFFLRLDNPEISSWITSYTSQGGAWALTAGHVANPDPTTFASRVLLGTNFNTPSDEYTVYETILYPTWAESRDLEHPDLALLRLTVPEPAHLSLLAIAGVALIRRRRAA